MKRYMLLAAVTAALLADTETIEEKLDETRQESRLSGQLDEYNTVLPDLESKLKERYNEVQKLAQYGADEGDYAALLEEITNLRKAIIGLKETWKEVSTTEAKLDDETFAFWDQEEVTLGQLVMDYGSSDYLYIVPPDISNLKLHLHSGIPIPRESWSDLLEVILSENGIGVTQLNPYARALYIMKQDLSGAHSIITEEAMLDRIPPEERVIFIFSPAPERIKGVSKFFDRFKNPKKSFVYEVGYKIAISASRSDIQKLLTLYKAVWEESNAKVTKVIAVTRLSVKDMEKVLSAYFSQSRLGRIALMKGEGDDLTIMPLAQEASIVLVGTKEMVEKAEKVIADTEKQVLDPCEMTVFSYTCRHADPIEVCEVLEKVYASLTYSKVEGVDTQQHYPQMPPQPMMPPENGGKEALLPPPQHIPMPQLHQKPVVEKSTTTNFIPYPKSGSIMMVIRRDALDKVKEILKKLDVPKKMVQIEVLLFEKKTGSKSGSGINLLKLGTNPDRKRATSLSFSEAANSKGILQFLISRTKKRSALPGFDIAYNFLMSQEGVRINASPSVTTLNQTPGQIRLVEERSINEGAVKVGSDEQYERKYVRSQYGTIISITPTIHEPEFGAEGRSRFVTLDTDITFETISSDIDDRPHVVRRHVENQVRIRDGETLILGGLKRKTGENTSEKIPFLGEIPGLGKLFGSSKEAQEETEMFIFITPKIILDTEDEFNRLRTEELTRRPGDIPEFLARVEEGKEREKGKLFSKSMKLLLGDDKE